MPVAPPTCPACCRQTTVPVLGVPVPSKYLRGEDSLLSIVQMPKGVPVATFAIGEAGATNAGLFAVAMLAIANKSLAQQLLSFRDEQTAGARAMLVAAGHGRQIKRTDARPGSSAALVAANLVRMFVHAARRWVTKVLALDPDASGPAAQTADDIVVTAYDDMATR